MNVKEYIRSGVVESYVLGMATEAERTEFEQLCASYPEIVNARDAFERALETELMQGAQQPPKALKEKIFLKIVPGVQETETIEAAVKEETPVRSIKMNLWKLAAAACFLGVIGVGYWAYTSNQKYSDARATQSNLQQELQQKNQALSAIEDEINKRKNPVIKVAALKGTATAPKASTTLVWDSTNKDVYLMVNNLPEPPTNKQYQLWALLDGKPIDLGMLESQSKGLVLKMKNVQKAQAFAITLEDKGGSPAPKGQMYAQGNL